MKQHTKEEIFRKGQALSCPIAPINSAEDLLSSEQLNARDFFVETEHPRAGRFTVPSSPYRFSKSPLRWERPAPLLGEHNEDVLCNRLGYTREDLVKLRETGVI
jgi:crotonobetainyl-CoA:carnitine CoA-transferase CaiB-like acyl-CoA transferase